MQFKKTTTNYPNNNTNIEKKIQNKNYKFQIYFIL